MAWKTSRLIEQIQTTQPIDCTIIATERLRNSDERFFQLLAEGAGTRRLSAAEWDKLKEGDRTMPRHLLVATAVASLMGMSYMAGTAQSQFPTTVNKLDQSVDHLKKAQAILGSIVTRQGVGNIDAAKAAINTSLSEIAKAKAANGG
jgi:hypothetical protein